MFGDSMSLDYFGGFLDQKITIEKKGTIVWPSVAMSDCFGGFVAIFFCGFLDQITNYDRKKGTVVWDGQMTPPSFFFGHNLIDEGRNPPKNIAHNFHFSKYEIW
jgi:hypothetical protein